MSLNEDLARIAHAAAAFAEPGEELAGVLAAEPAAGERVYLCAYARSDGARTWLAFGDDGVAIEDRVRIRDAVSIAALCELADDAAGGGELEELRSQLVALGMTENLLGVAEAGDAARAEEAGVGARPRVASAA